MTVDEMLEDVKKRVWFYEFELPDGSRTASDIPDHIRPIHSVRRDQLRRTIACHVDAAADKTALDFASHEGYFSIELAKHFKSVVGLEIRKDSMEAARLITTALAVPNVQFVEADLQKMEPAPGFEADFVLMYGLLYHLENPIHTLRLASALCREHLLLETQVFPYEITGLIEDGHYDWQRNVEGVFALASDYSGSREGGSTDIAFIPSLGCITYLLKTFGFKTVELAEDFSSGYEQFKRRSRVIVHARK